MRTYVDWLDGGDQEDAGQYELSKEYRLALWGDGGDREERSFTAGCDTVRDYNTRLEEGFALLSSAYDEVVDDYDSLS